MGPIKAASAPPPRPPAYTCKKAQQNSKTRTSKEEQQKATNGKWKHVPKTKTSNKKQRRAFSHSSALTLDLWKLVEIKHNEKPERATNGNDTKLTSAKGNEEHQNTKTDIGDGKTKTGNKKPKRATKGTKRPSGN